MASKEGFLERRVKNLRILGYLLQLAPFVRAVILTGSMTTGSAKKSSDIDLLIVTAPQRLYTARLFATFWTIVTGLRRTPKTLDPSGKFCLNYYLSVNNLDILPHNDRCAKFHRHIIRVWDKDGIYERIYRENQWLRDFPVKIVGSGEVEILNKNFPINRSVIFSILRRSLEYILSGQFGDLIEEKIGKWQMDKILSSSLYKKNKKTIIVEAGELRLHPKKVNPGN